MLRTSASRLLASTSQRAFTRPISSSAPALIRIKKPEGAAPPSNSTPPTPPPASTPPPPPPAAEKPVKTAADVATPPPAEPAAPAADAAAADTTAQATEPEAAEDVIPDKPDLSKLPSLDIDPEMQPVIEEPKPKGGKAGAKGDRKRPQYESSIERQRRIVSRTAYGALFLGGLGALWYIGEQDKAEKENVSLMDRIKRNVTELSDYFSKPAFKHLLPDPLPAPHQRPYTLLVDLEDLLVHSEWDRQHGWRTAKRPGVDYFLGYLSQFYEIVLFTSQPVYTAIPIAEKLDPFSLYLPYKLFRDSTRYVDGKVVKDLSYLNRDLSKVVMLDTNPEHSALQPDNAIIIQPWNGARGDKGLVEMIPFLESIGIYAPADVRPVLKHYADKDIPREYAKKEAEAKAAAVEQWERTHPNAAAGAGSSFLSSIFGGGAASRPSQPMTYLEVKRQQAQRQYEEEQKYYKDNAEEFTRLLEEDKARQMAEMKGNLMGMFGGPAPAVKEGEQAAPAGQQGQQAQAQQPAAK